MKQVSQWKKNNKKNPKAKQQGYLALSLPETLSSPFSKQRQSIGNNIQD